MFYHAFYIIGILGIYLNHAYDPNEEVILKIMLCLGLFAANALIINALSNNYEKFNKKTQLIALVVNALACFGYYFTINPDLEYTYLRTVVIFFAQGLIFISLPFTKEDRKTEHFFNSIAGRLIITTVMFYIAWGGISGIFYALEELFGLNISNEIYMDVPIILSTTFVPMVWLFGIRYDIEPKTTKLYKTLLVYVCMTLLIAYTSVVYGYILKILFDGFKMPSSIIGHLVLWYSLVGMAVYFLSRSYTDKGYGKFFITWYPRASVLPLIIMFISIFMRINQYGYTINRVYLLLGGIYLALMTAYILYTQITKKKLRNIVIPLAMAIIALVSIIEPVSAYSIALNSQQNELAELMEKYPSGDDFNVKSMSDEDVLRAQDIIRYITWNTVNEEPRPYEGVEALSISESNAVMEEYRYQESDYYENMAGVTTRKIIM